MEWQSGEYVAHPTFLSSVNQRRTRSGIALVLRSVHGRQAVFRRLPSRWRRRGDAGTFAWAEGPERQARGRSLGSASRKGTRSSGEGLIRTAAAPRERDAVLSVPQDGPLFPRVHLGDGLRAAGEVPNLGAAVLPRAQRVFRRAWLARLLARNRLSVPNGRAPAFTGSAWIAAASSAIHMAARPAPPRQGLRAARAWQPAAWAGPASRKPRSIGSGASPRSSDQVITAPGFMIPWGSSAALIARMAASFAGSA